MVSPAYPAPATAGTRAMAVAHPHLAATYEVLEIAGRPAVLQEWLTGLPSGDWSALAAAPGVWYRLVGQSALGGLGDAEINDLGNGQTVVRSHQDVRGL